MITFKSLLSTVLLLCAITFLSPTKAHATPPCFLFTITGSSSIAAVYLDGNSIKGTTATFVEGDQVSGSYGGCPPWTQTVATITVYRYNILTEQYVIIQTTEIQLSTACESGIWTLHTKFNGQQPPCGVASASYSVDQLYCPCGS